MSDEEKAFVNRHGHKVDGTLEAAPTPEPFTPNKADVKPKKVKKVRGKRSKKSFVITVIVLLILLLIPVVGGELVRARYLSTRDNAKSQLIEFATKTVVTEQKKQMKLAQLSDAAARVEDIRDHTCDGGFNDNIAMLYPRAKEAYNQCIVLKHKIADIATNLRDIESQVRYLEALNPILDPIAKDTSEGFAIISAQHENWKTFDEALGKLSPAASQRATHDKMKEQSKAIVADWSALDTANNSQDAAGFTDAEKKLSEDYETFRSSSAGLLTLLNATQRKLTASYKAL